MSIELRGGSGTGNGTQEMLGHNDSIPVEEKEETSPPPSNQQSVSFYKLYSFADGLDYVLMLVGGIAAAIHGAAIPIFFIFFGKLIHTMGTASGNLALVSTEVAKYSMDFFYLGLVVMLAGWMEVSCWMITGDRQSSRMRTKYLGALMKQDVGFFDTGISTGEIVVGISSDTALVQEAIGEKVGNYIHYISRFIAGFAVGFSSVWKLTLVTLSVVPCIAFAGGVYAYIMIGLTSKSQKAYIKAGAIAEEAIAQIRTVHSFVGEEKVAKSYSRALSTTLKLGTKGGLTKGIGVGVMYGLLFCSWALLLWYSGLLVRHGIINGGQAITTIFTVIISALALGQAAPDLTAFGKAKVAGYTILEMIKRKPEIVNNDTHGIKLTTVEGHIEFRNVSFSYPSRVDARIFEDFSLNIPAGKVTALVGSSGSGKSTVISLIERFYDPSSGEVLLDGRNIRELQLRWLRQQIGLVSQEPALFATSIRENISYGKDDPSMEEIEQATKVSGAYVFISQLPNGFDTQVGERGVQLSGGQKQRIAIARALLKNPSILLLDEATSALDAVSEKGVQEALDIAMVGRTSIVVAHRLSTIRNADVIAVVQRGQVVEIGIHDELMTSSVGTYASLVKLQEAGSKQQQQQYQDGAKIAGSHSRLSNGSMSRRTFSFHLSVQSEKDFGGVGTKPDGEIERSAPRPSLKRLLMLNLPEWPYGLLGILGAILAGAQNPLFSLTISHALVAFYSTDNAYIKEEVLKIALVFCGAGVVTIFIFFMEHYFFGIAGERLTKRVREMMFTAVLRNEIGWFDEHSSSLLASQLSTDATLVRAAIADRLSTVVQNLAMVVTAFIIAFILTWKVSLVVVATYPVLVAAHASEYLFLKGFGGDLTKAYERSSMVAGEAVSNIRTVAAFCAEDKVVELFSRELAKPKVQLFVRGQVAGLGYGVSQFCSYSSYGLSLWYASTLIKNNEVGFGPVIKCFMVLIITALGIAETLALAPDIVKASRAVGSVFEILDRKTEINPDDPSADIIEMVRGAIEFQHVKFSYPSRPDTVIFEDLNLRALPGQTLALVGSSGSGKSSVIALIARFYDPLSGQVTIDGKDIRKLKLRSLRRHIGLVQQEPALFATTIYENILYGRDGATEAEVEEAARSANAHTFISSLPQGYGTEVGERGIQLSGGQKQRVAIARAVLKNPPVLLLDEATSALDAESEHVVQDALDRLMTRRTTIIVAHRLSTIKNADQIAVLEGGCVVEQGSHYELISKAGAYARLISLQGGQQSKPSTSPL